MADGRIGLAEVLAAAEAAAPVNSLDVVARNLRDRFGARYVSFLFVDVVGRRLLRVHDTAAVEHQDRAAQVPLSGSSVYDEVLRNQRPVLAPDGGQGRRVLAPVTNRGDTIGVLELFLPDVTPDVLAQIGEAAHALAYIIVTDRRFTDLYHWGNRTTTVSLSAEIQRQLLPTAAACEAPEFTLAGALVPAADIASDTYDYSLDTGTLHLSITDAMGHDVGASLMATLLVSASRGARRAGEDLAEQARQVHQALLDHGNRTIATGQLLRIALDGTSARLVNAGHPGHCACATAPSPHCASSWTCPSVSRYRAPTGSRTSTCNPVTASCSIRTACRNATRKRSTCRACCARRPKSTRVRSCARWSALSPMPTTAVRRRTTPPCCAWTGTAPGAKALMARTTDPGPGPVRDPAPSCGHRVWSVEAAKRRDRAGSRPRTDAMLGAMPRGSLSAGGPAWPRRFCRGRWGGCPSAVRDGRRGRRRARRWSRAGVRAAAGVRGWGRSRRPAADRRGG